MIWNAARDEQIGENIHDIVSIKAVAIHPVKMRSWSQRMDG